MTCGIGVSNERFIWVAGRSGLSDGCGCGGCSQWAGGASWLRGHAPGSPVFVVLRSFYIPSSFVNVEGGVHSVRDTAGAA